jgi:hypothetical protein
MDRWPEPNRTNDTRANAELPSRPRGQHVLLHGGHAPAPTDPVRAARSGGAAGGDPRNACRASSRHRSLGVARGSLALPLVHSRWRHGRLDPLGLDQERVHKTRHGRDKRTEGEHFPREAPRERHMATPFLGAPSEGRTRLRGSLRLCALQPRKAWPGCRAEGLARVDLSPVRATRVVPPGSGFGTTGVSGGGGTRVRPRKVVGRAHPTNWRTLRRAGEARRTLKRR